VAIDYLNFPIMWSSEFGKDLTDSDDIVAPRRGRPTGLSDAQLYTRRDQFVQIFEGAWFDIYRELQRCKKPDDLIRIFTPIANPQTWSHEPLGIFCRSSSESASGATLRRVRGELRSVVEPLYTAELSKRRAEEQLHQTNSALANARGSDRRMVKRARKKKRKEAWKAEVPYRPLAKKEKQLRERLIQLEASFARQELFNFLKSERYTLTPLNLANAVAGLPHMGWRRSVTRGKKAASKIANGTMFQIFKAMRYLVTNANRKSENELVASIHDGILSLPSRYQLPKAELAKNWFSLRRAIRQAYRNDPLPKALICDIAKRYFKLIHSQTQVEIALTEQFKLNLTKRPERRTPSQPMKPDSGSDRNVKIMEASE
jgi:hypothetical protein